MWRIAYIFFLSLLPVKSMAQWVETAPSLLGPISQSVGAMTYANGVAWAGAYSLWSSTDYGTTWNQNGLSLNGAISHIFFIDRNNGLVTTHAGSIYRTSDAGATWKNILNIPSATSACFLDSSSNILVSEFISPGNVHFSRDGGDTWTVVPIDTWIREIIPIGKGKAYLLAGDWSPGEHLWLTTDYGASWTEQPALLDADCWSFAIDPCEPKTMYVVNEGYSQTVAYDGLSRLFVSTDAGSTWGVTSNHHSDYYAGSLTLGVHTVFAQTVPEIGAGLVRSSDHGQTWTNIGGPSTSADTRFISAIDDNHLIAVDNDGSIWITTNSGGDSISLPQTLSWLEMPALVAQNGKNSCTLADTSISLFVNECRPSTSTLDSLWITGSPAFAITDTRMEPRTLATVDSILVSYAASVGGNDSALLHLRYDIGSGPQDTAILLTGTASSLAATPQILHRSEASAYYGQLDSLTMAVDISPSVNLDSLWPFVTDIHATFAFDSSVAQFQSYLAPPGWLLTSLTSNGNSVDFGIHKVSGSANNPLELGVALFSPNSTTLATTWVALPRFVIEAGDHALSLCVSQNEDSHWAVKTLGVLSDITEQRSSADDLVIYPNPAAERLFLRNPLDREVNVTIYDVIGREVLSTEVLARSTQTVSLTSLLPGTYLIVHSGNCVVVSHE